MQAWRRRGPPPVSADPWRFARCRTPPSRTCRAIRRLAARPRGISCARSMRSAASWAWLSMPRAFSSSSSTAAAVQRSGRRGRRLTSAPIPPGCARPCWRNRAFSGFSAKPRRVLTDGGRVSGLAMETGERFSCRALVITTGTFLNGLVHIGPEQRPSGRAGEPPSHELAESLRGFGFRMGRLKTGTPPRLSKRSIDFSAAFPRSVATIRRSPSRS